MYASLPNFESFRPVVINERRLDIFRCIIRKSELEDIKLPCNMNATSKMGSFTYSGNFMKIAAKLNFRLSHCNPGIVWSLKANSYCSSVRLKARFLGARR